MSKFRFRFLAGLVVFLSLFLFTAVQAVDVNNFTIKAFSADYYLSKNDTDRYRSLIKKLDLRR